MKKTLQSIPILVCFYLLFLSPLAASTPTGCERGGSSPFRGSVDLLLWKTRKCHLDYLYPQDVNRYDVDCSLSGGGEPQSVDGSVVILGKGCAKTVEPNLSAGCRISLYGPCRYFEPGICYTHYSTSPSSSWKKKSIPFSTSRSHPNLKGYVSGIYVEEGKGEYALSYDVVDLECGKKWNAPFCQWLKLYGNATFAHIDQEMKTTYKGHSTPIQGNDPELLSLRHTIVEKNRLDGYGLTLGAELHYLLCNKLSLYAKASLSTLVGSFSRSFVEKELPASGERSFTTPCEPSLLVSVCDSHNAVVSHLAYAIAMQYDFSLYKRCANLTVGYEIHQWSSMLGFIQFVDSREIAATARNQESLGFDGLFCRINISY